MKNLLLIFVYCAVIAIPVQFSSAHQYIPAAALTDHSVMVANQTSGNVAIYFTGNNAGVRGYVDPNSGSAFGPIPEGTYTALIVTNAGGTRTFTVNGQSVTNTNGQATFTVNVTSSVYIVVQ